MDVPLQKDKKQMPNIPKKSIPVQYPHLEKTLNSGAYVFSKVISFRYNNECSDTLLTYNLYNVGTKKTFPLSDKPVKLKHGVNHFSFPVPKKLVGRKGEQHVFVLEVSNARKEKWQMKFSINEKNKKVFMKNTGIIGLTVGAIAFLMSAFCLYKMEVNKNLAFVELQSVFNEFEMTKQYKGKLETVLNARKSIADSLQLNLTAQSKMLKQVNNKNDEKVQNFLYEKEVYLEKMKQFQEDNVALKRQYDGEINKQLNQYIKEYGEKRIPIHFWCRG